MNINLRQLLYWFPAALLILTSGCTGGKFNSMHLGSYQFYGQPKDYSSVSVRSLKDVTDANVFTNALISKLNESKLFHEVREISAGETAATPLLLEVRIMSAVDQSYSSRAFGPAKSDIGVAGRLVDVGQDKVLLTFELSRLAQGGLLGQGGFFTASDEKMRQAIADWLAEDIIAILRKHSNAKDSSAGSPLKFSSVSVLVCN